MRTVAERPAILQLFVTLAAFLVGSLLGIGLGSRVSPDSQLAQIVTSLTLPLAFVAGLLFWFGRGLLGILSHAIRNRRREGRAGASRDAASRRIVPPGYGSFLVFSLGFSCVAGLFAAAVSEAGFARAVGLHAIVGGAYGYSLRWLAHEGYLPFPEPE